MSVRPSFNARSMKRSLDETLLLVHPSYDAHGLSPLIDSYQYVKYCMRIQMVYEQTHITGRTRQLFYRREKQIEIASTQFLFFKSTPFLISLINAA